MLIVTPLVLIWTAEPRSMWRRRRLSVAVPLGLACVLAISVFVKASAWEQEAQQLQFQLGAKTLAQALTRNLHGYLEVLYAIESFFASSQEVNRQEFHTFVQRSFARHSGLQALS